MPVKGILKPLLLLAAVVALIAAAGMAFAGQAQAAPKSGKAISNTATAPVIDCRGISVSFSGFPNMKNSIFLFVKIDSGNYARYEYEFSGASGSIFHPLEKIGTFTVTAYAEWSVGGGGKSSVAGPKSLSCGSIKLVKELIPSNDPGRFDLFIDNLKVASAVGNGGSGGPVFLPAGDYVVSERGATGTNLADYNSSVDCGTDPPGTSLEVKLGAGETMVCRFINVRQPPPTPYGNLQVCKILSPSNDPGRFDLKVNGITLFNFAGNGSCTFVGIFQVGSHTVSETAAAGSGTNISDYTSRFSCVSDQSPTLTGEGTAVTVNLKLNEYVVCTFTNTRKTPPPPPAPTGTIKLCKMLVPTIDPGKFNLMVGSEVVLPNAGHKQCGSKVLPVGTYTVSEVAGTATSLSDYMSTVDCVSSLQSVDPDGTSLSVNLRANEIITCTFINARKTTVTTTITIQVPVDRVVQVPAAQGVCPADTTTVTGSNPVVCIKTVVETRTITKTITKVKIKKVKVKPKPKPKPKKKAKPPSRPKTTP